MKILQIILVMIALVCANAARAQWDFANPFTFGNVPVFGGKGLAEDTAGNAYVMPRIAGDLYVRVRDVDTGNWGVPEIVSDTTVLAEVADASIVWNAGLGTPVIAYSSNQRIWFAVRTDNGWTRTAITEANETAWFPDIACNSDGTMYIVWIDEDGDEYQLNYAFNDGNGWQRDDIAAELGAFGLGANPRAAVGAAGEGHVIFRGVVVGAYAAQYATNETAGNDDWIVTTLQVPHAESYPGNIAVSADGNVHCVSQGSEGFGIPRQAYYHERDLNGSWTFGLSVSEQSNAGEPRVAVNSASAAHCVWLELSGNFYTGLLGYVTEEWDWEINDIYGNADGDVAFVIDGRNYGHILVSDVSGNVIYERSTEELILPEVWPEIDLSPDTIDFDTIMVSELVAIVGWAHNVGDVELELIRGFTAGDGFWGGGLLHGFLQPGGGGHGTDIRFEPAEPGEYQGWWVVESSAPSSPDSVYLHGVAVPDTVFAPVLRITPEELDFDSVRVGEDSIMQVELANVGDADLFIDAFDVFGDGFGGPPQWIDVTLQPGAFMTTEVRFGPTQTGRHLGFAVVVTNEVFTPDSIQLEGWGIPGLDASPEPLLPLALELKPLYPNPFNGAVNVSFTLSRESAVSLRVYDVLGREVSTLANGSMQAGLHTTQWNCAECAAGIYLFKLEAAGQSFVQKAAFVK